MSCHSALPFVRSNEQESTPGIVIHSICYRNATIEEVLLSSDLVIDGVTSFLQS